MSKLIWATDIHLDCLNQGKARQFAKTLQEAVEANGGPLEAQVLITGDIATGKSLMHHLSQLRQSGGRSPIGLSLPPYFVCGNHDYWRSSFEETHRLCRLMTEKGIARWVTGMPPIRLSEKTVMTGVDGFYDCRAGSPLLPFEMNCWDRIIDLRGLDREALIRFCRENGEKLARLARDKLLEALPLVPDGGKVVFATHYPPFPEASRYRHNPAEAYALPWYTWAALGDVLLDVCDAHPTKNILVLCGHTHWEAQLSPRDNLLVRVGPADYGAPCIVDIIDV